MRSTPFLVGILALFTVVWQTGRAQTVDLELLQQTLVDQQQVLSMTQEWIENVLDRQLQQLEENHLTTTAQYRDLRSTRNQIAALVETELASVIEQLTSLKELPEAKREVAFREARLRSRSVMWELSIVRQKLLNRLKVNQLAEQLLHVIDFQTEVQNATRRLTQAGITEVVPLAQKVMEDQLDAQKMCLLLVASLEDVQTWGGRLSKTALDSLQTLQVHETTSRLTSVNQTLQSAKYSEAVTHQQAVLERLRIALSQWQTSQGEINGDYPIIGDQLQKLIAEQTELRKETQQRESTSSTLDDLVTRQVKLEQELSRFADSTRLPTEAAAHLNHAMSSANEAAEQLFQSHHAVAVRQQTKILGHLAAMETTMSQSSDITSSNLSAEEFADLIRLLEKTQQQLITSQQLLQAAKEQLGNDPAISGESEKRALSVVNDLLQLPTLPASAMHRLQAVVESLEHDITSPGNDEQNRVPRELQRAQTTIAAALHTTKRQYVSVLMGELARSAEVLERAAVEEREIAESVIQMMTPADAANANHSTQKLVDRQSLVQTVAVKLAVSMQNTSPHSSEGVDAGRLAAQMSGEKLNQLENSSEFTTNGNAAVDSARSSAGQFEAVAQALRAEIQHLASTYSQSSSAEADQLKATRENFEHSLVQLVETTSQSLEQQPQEQQQSQMFAELIPKLDQLFNDVALLDLGVQEALFAAKDAAQAGATAQLSPPMQKKLIEQVQQNFERALANLIVQEHEIRREQFLSEALSEIAKEQQIAAESIQKLRNEAASNANQAEKLAESTDRFAEAQYVMGQGVVELSEQVEVANKPLREALELSSQFGRLSATDLRGATESDGAEHPANPSSTDDTPLAEGEQSSQEDNPAIDLGTGFVPKSPEVTAKMMAGREAQKAMQAARDNSKLRDRARGVPAKSNSKTSALMKRMSKAKEDYLAANPQDIPDFQTTAGFSQSKQASQTENSAVKQGPAHKLDEGTKVSESSGGGSRDGDASESSRSLRNAAWFTRLPPELRSSFRANAQQRAPRGYEETLRKYFESVD